MDRIRACRDRFNAVFTESRVISRVAVKGLLAALLGFHAGIPHSATAMEWPLPPPGADIVGEIRTVTAGAKETLLDIGRRFDVGYEEIIAANPGIDPWLPEDGSLVTIPSRYILPDAPREGIVVNLAEMRLYYYPAPRAGERATVITHPLGVGREGWSTPLGRTRIAAKHRNPAWYVPDSIRREKRADGIELPAVVPPGPDNPLGRFALRLGHGAYLLHGTNRPFSVGMRVSHGCLRLYPEDIAMLFERVNTGTPVTIVNQPYKLGKRDGVLYFEAHRPLTDEPEPVEQISMTPVVRAVTRYPAGTLNDEQWQDLFKMARKATGVPQALGNILEDTPASQIERQPVTGWSVGAGLFRDKTNADVLVSQLKKHLLPATMRFDGKQFWQVLVGPYSSQQNAERARTTVELVTGETSILVPP